MWFISHGSKTCGLSCITHVFYLKLVDFVSSASGCLRAASRDLGLATEGIGWLGEATLRQPGLSQVSLKESRAGRGEHRLAELSYLEAA